MSGLLTWHRRRIPWLGVWRLGVRWVVPLLMAGAANGPAHAGAIASWLASADLSREATAEALASAWASSPADAREHARTLQAALGRASGEQALAIRLVAAVALERAGDSAAARAGFLALANEARGGPYGASAAFRQGRLENLDKPVEQQEAAYRKVAQEAEAAGWFLVDGAWYWTTTRRAAWQALVDLRSDRLSMQLFAFLRSKSLFLGAPLAFLGVLVVLGVGAKILQFPMLVRLARMQGQIGRLQPQARYIQSMHSGDPLEMNRQLMALYAANGIEMKWGCLVALVDLIFVIWALISLSDFSPQMALDGASLWWVSDVTKWDLGILIVWALMMLVQPLADPTRQLNRGQMAVGSVVTSALFVWISRHWDWPSYVFIFWALLVVTGFALNLALWPVRALARR